MKTRNYFILIIFLLGFSLSVSARKVEQQDAEKVAKNHYYETFNQYHGQIAYDDILITNIFTKTENGEPVFYAFDIQGGGFVIVSAEDAAYPVIGYSYQGKFPVNVNTESGYGRFLESRVENILYARNKQVQADDIAQNMWDHLLYSAVAELSTETKDRSVEPLLTSTWDQNDPYNILCPYDPMGPGDHVYAGCVATCMAMVMHYWRYPETGTGSHSYFAPGYGMQSADFGNTTYNWYGMQNSIDDYNPFPIAELQYQAGVAVDMGYGYDGSGTYSHLVDDALKNYFSYNAAQYLEKDNFTMTNWMNILKGEIDAGNPLYYSGQSSSGGHAFGCDGYEGNSFHFNFGWSGSGNGYYSLYDVNSYNNYQACVRFFYPTDSEYPYFASGHTVITSMSGSITDGSGPIEDYLNNTTASWLIDPQTEFDSVINIKINFQQFNTEADDDFVTIYDGETEEAPVLGTFSGEDLPSQIISTSNKVLITFESDNNNPAAGWYLEYSAKAAEYCSGMTNFASVSEVFSDGSLNFNYNNSASCMWKIEPAYASEITLYFDSFETEEAYDVVKVFDGTTVIGEFSGSDLPDPVVATSGSMFITFNSNKNTNMAGWEAYYETGNVGMKETRGFDEFRMYPNPATDQLSIYFEDDENADYGISISSLTGSILYKEDFSADSRAVYKSIDVSNLPAGVYIMKIDSETKSMVQRVVIE